MTLSGYSGAAYEIAKELRSLLLQDDYAGILAQLPSDASQRLDDLRRESPDVLRKIVTATPRERPKALQPLTIDQRFWAIAAAAQMAFEASEVLQEAKNLLVPGASYRDMIWDVHEVLQAQYRSEEADWPFPER